MGFGFFKSDRLENLSPIRATGCASCGLAASGCLNPKMEPTGDGKRKILFLAEAPGETEDKTGIQLVGKAGRRLRSVLDRLGYDLDKDCRKTNSVACRPLMNRTPERREIEACRHRVLKEIQDNPPHVVVLLGGPSLVSYLGHRWKSDSDLSISRWAGLRIPDHEIGCWVCPTFHPSYIERNSDQPVVEILWTRHLKKALQLWDTPLPDKIDPKVHVLEGDEIEKYLLGLYQRAKKQTSLGQQITIGIDYETTGLKPYREGHKIVACSIAESVDEAYAWWWEEDAKALFREICLSKDIRKVGANMKFEQVWSRRILGHPIENWWWDTVLAGHILDNRKGNSGVKFQSFTRLGIIDYSSHIKPFLVAPTPNDFNNITKAPKKELLEYNGRDSAFELALAYHQREEMGYSY